jgi:hypothetical protein
MVNIVSNTTYRTLVVKEVNRSLHTCAQYVQITCTTNNKVNNSQCYDYSINKVYLLQNEPRIWKDYRASSTTAFILSMAWTTSTGDDRGRGLSSFPPLAWTGHLDSILLDHLWQWKARLSRLMVATQQVREKMAWGLFVKECLTQVWLAESGGCILCQKLLWLTIMLKTTRPY